MKNKITTYSILILTFFLWGISFVFTDIVFKSDGNITPFILIAFRLIISILFFLSIFAITRKRIERIERKDYKLFLLLALFEPFFYFIGENYGVKYSSPSISSVVTATIPVFVPFAVFFVHKESLKWYNIFGVCFSMIGVVVMTVFSKTEHQISEEGLGIGVAFLFFAVASAVGYSVFLQKVVQKYKPITITFYQNTIGLIYFIPMLLIFDMQNIPKISLTLQTISCIVILGVFCSSIAFFLYGYSVKKIGVSRACIFNNLIPAFTILTAVALGREELTVAKIAGMIIVVSGVLITQLSANNKLFIKTNGK